MRHFTLLHQKTFLRVTNYDPASATPFLSRADDAQAGDQARFDLPIVRVPALGGVGAPAGATLKFIGRQVLDHLIHQANSQHSALYTLAVPIITPIVSPTLLETIQRAEAMHGYILSTSPDRFSLESDENILVVGIYSLVEEHHGAILHLFRSGQFDGSALALVRPLVDACYRAHWIYSCANPAIISRLRRGANCYPGLRNMAEAVEKKLTTDGFFVSVTPIIQSLHGYTHGGLEQISQRFDDEGNVCATYSDSMKQEAIRAITSHYVALSIAWCELINKVAQKESLASIAISKRYRALYLA